MKSSSSSQFIVLGAGRPTGSIGVQKASLKANGTPWIVSAIANHVEQRHFVAGYDLESAAVRYPEFMISVNANWSKTGNVASLLCVPFEVNHNLLVSYADVLFREEIVQRLLADNSDVVVAVDQMWRERYARRTEHDLSTAEKVAFEEGKVSKIGSSIDIVLAQAEFIGLVKFSPKVAMLLKEKNGVVGNLENSAMLPDLISELLKDDTVSVSWHDVAGDWSELNAPQDLAHFVLGTKAETLDRIRSLVQTLYVEDQVRFTVRDYTSSSSKVIGDIQTAFNNAPVIVRSSAQAEDSWQTANAGAFESVLNVDSSNAIALGNAIDRVIASYDNVVDVDQILVQPMVHDVVASGVAFTRTLSHGAPYFVINFDNTEGQTDGVTGGTGFPQMLFVHHEAPSLPWDAPAWAKQLIVGIKELIGLVGYDSLDIEFAVNDAGKIILLQLRPIAVDHSKWTIDDKLLKMELGEAERRFRSLSEHTGNVLGSRAVFGVMPDWNPAEIIGTRPSLLSSSLYRYLICDETWALQRAQYGYRDVRPQPLIVAFAGHPFVNVRASMSSFVPDSLPDSLGNRLVDHYLERLIDHPEFHDKVEFDVAFTCLSFDFHERANRQLGGAGFTEEEIETLRKGLATVTGNGFRRYGYDLTEIENLGTRFDYIMGRDLSHLERACMLLEDCRRFGTLAFSHLARSGFVAMTLLRSAVNLGYINQDFLDRYLGSISTVAKEFVQDGQKLAATPDFWQAFIGKYGHLRPGTYDILSPTYRERENLIKGQFLEETATAGITDHKIKPLEWPKEGQRKIVERLEELGVRLDFDQFDTFCRTVIEGREYAKFVFTRNLSQALDELVSYGQQIGVDRARLSNVPIESLFALRAGETFGQPDEFISQLSEFYESRRKVTQNAELPPLIHSVDQFYAFNYPSSQPNFVGTKSITAPVHVQTDNAHCELDDVKNKVVVIPQADPGFDWLFGCGIVGLVTAYGGANSHMAIRCAEFGLPAAIGVGEVMFERLQHAGMVSLDCSQRTIQIIT